MSNIKAKSAALALRQARVNLRKVLETEYPMGASVNVARSAGKTLVCHVIGHCGPSDVMQAGYTSPIHDGYVCVENTRTGNAHTVHFGDVEVRL